MATVNANLDVTKYVRVNVGLNPVMLQAHRDSVRIVFNDLQPSKDNTSFHLLNGSDGPLQVSSIDTNVWALSMTDKSTLTITETARQYSDDFIFNVSKGLVPGHSMVYVNSYANTIGTTEKLIWPFASQYVFSDTPSTLYLSSTNAADTQTLLIDWLDGDYVQHQDFVALNGQTPVEFAMGMGSRVNRALVTGPTETQGNVYIARDNAHTNGVPNDSSMIVMAFEQRTQTRSMGMYTVPAGHTLYGVSGYFSAPKNRDNDFFWNIRNPDTGLPATNTNVVSVYQSTVEVNFRATPVPEKTDAFFTSSTETGNGRVSSRIVAMLVDNEYI